MKCATLLAMPSTPAWLHRCSITCSRQNHTDHLGSTGSRWFIVHVLPVYGMQSDFAERQLTRSAAADLHNTLTVAEHMNTLQLVCSCIPEQYAVGWRACYWRSLLLAPKATNSSGDAYYETQEDPLLFDFDKARSGNKNKKARLQVC